MKFEIGDIVTFDKDKYLIGEIDIISIRHQFYFITILKTSQKNYPYDFMRVPFKVMEEDGILLEYYNTPLWRLLNE